MKMKKIACFLLLAAFAVLASGVRAFAEEDSDRDLAKQTFNAVKKIIDSKPGLKGKTLMEKVCWNTEKSATPPDDALIEKLFYSKAVVGPMAKVEGDKLVYVDYLYSLSATGEPHKTEYYTTITQSNGTKYNIYSLYETTYHVITARCKGLSSVYLFDTNHLKKKK